MATESKKAKVVFTIDLEDWDDALHIPDIHSHSSLPILDNYLLPLLAKYNVRAIIYKIEYIPFISSEHDIKTHGKYHRRWEIADRRPYQWLGFTGGFWFRVFPFWIIKRQVIKNGMFYLHLHDIDEDHPKLKNPILNFKRHIGLKNSRKKLERLLQEVKFE